MKVASPFISMQFHASLKIPAMDTIHFVRLHIKHMYPHHQFQLTTQRALDQSLAAELHKVPLAFNLGILSRICVPASSRLPTLPVRGGFSGHLTVLNFIFIAFLSQGTHIKSSPLKCHTSWSDICTFFQLFRPQRLLCSSSWKHYQRATNQIYYFSLIKVSSCSSQINGISLSFYASL